MWNVSKKEAETPKLINEDNEFTDNNIMLLKFGKKGNFPIILKFKNYNEKVIVKERIKETKRSEIRGVCLIENDKNIYFNDDLIQYNQDSLKKNKTIYKKCT